jgi:hypothetical protein
MLRQRIRGIVATLGSGQPDLVASGTSKLEGIDQGVRAKVLAGVAYLTLGNVQFQPRPFAGEELFPGEIELGRELGFELQLWPDIDAIREIDRASPDNVVRASIQTKFSSMIAKGGQWHPRDGYSTTVHAKTLTPPEWAALLKGFGLGSRWRATVKVPAGPFATEFAASENDIARAFSRYADGHYKESVQACRDVLEKMWDAVGNGKGGPQTHWPADGAFSPGAEKKIDARHLPKQGRELVSAKLYKEIRALQDFANIGAHEGYEVTRPMAELAYSQTLLILQMLSDELA